MECWVYVKFQFLIGRLKTFFVSIYRLKAFWFQFLIGRLKTNQWGSAQDGGSGFQFLIGRLKTRQSAQKIRFSFTGLTGYLVLAILKIHMPQGFFVFRLSSILGNFYATGDRRQPLVIFLNYIFIPAFFQPYYFPGRIFCCTQVVKYHRVLILPDYPFKLHF